MSSATQITLNGINDQDSQIEVICTAVLAADTQDLNSPNKSKTQIKSLAHLYGLNQQTLNLLQKERLQQPTLNYLQMRRSSSSSYKLTTTTTKRNTTVNAKPLQTSVFESSSPLNETTSLTLINASLYITYQSNSRRELPLQTRSRSRNLLSNTRLPTSL